MLRFIGDIHGNWAGYKTIIANCDYTIQVGDYGLGFYDFPKDILDMGGTHRFIRGNHDNPELCAEHPWYLGDYGYIEKFGDFTGGIMYIGGAWTPDFYDRIEGVSIWHNEELDYAALNYAVCMAEQFRPKIIVTHDCPRELKGNHLRRDGYVDNNGDRFRATRTDNALQALFERHQPDLWVFGHYHHRFETRLNGTKFVCIETFGILDIE